VYNGPLHQLFIDSEKAYDLFSREVVYNILTESGIPMMQLKLIKMPLIETYSIACIGKNLIHFPFRMA
jgi:hypothetical protein